MIFTSLLLIYGCAFSENLQEEQNCISGKVIYTKYLDSNNVYSLDLETRIETVVFNDPSATGIGSSTWSPDGKKISVPIYEGDNSEIFIISVDSNTKKKITNTPYIELSPRWSPNGKYILAITAINNTGQLIKIDVDNSQFEILTNGNETTQWSVSQPAWSPDGNQVVFISNKDRDIPNGIYIMDIRTRELTLISKEIQGYVPAWSPNSEYIIFNSTGLSQKTRLVLYDIKNKDFSLLIPNDKGDTEETSLYSFGSAMWSQDGRCILFIKAEGEKEILSIINFFERKIIELYDIGLTNSIDWYSD